MPQPPASASFNLRVNLAGCQCDSSCSRRDCKYPGRTSAVVGNGGGSASDSMGSGGVARRRRRPDRECCACFLSGAFPRERRDFAQEPDEHTQPRTKSNQQEVNKDDERAQTRAFIEASDVRVTERNRRERDGASAATPLDVGDPHLFAIFVPPSIIDVTDLGSSRAEEHGSSHAGPAHDEGGGGEAKATTPRNGLLNFVTGRRKSLAKQRTQDAEVKIARGGSCRTCCYGTGSEHEDRYERLLGVVAGRIHPSLSQLKVRAVVSVTRICTEVDSLPAGSGKHPSAGVVLLEAPDESPVGSATCSTRGLDASLAISIILDEVNGEAMNAAPYAVIKVLRLSDLSFHLSPPARAGEEDSPRSFFSSDGSEAVSVTLPLSMEEKYAEPEIPSCPVCLHRIDPLRLGLPSCKSHQLCSPECAVSSEDDMQIDRGGTDGDRSFSPSSLRGCSNRLFLSPWPRPSNCAACHIILEHSRLVASQAAILAASETTTYPALASSFGDLRLDAAGDSGAPSSHSPTTSLSPEAPRRASVAAKDVCCAECGMRETLWLCLTCGVVGCGRYSHGHAERHYYETNHPFSLELATLRIWDYVEAEFVQRSDLLTCPLLHRSRGDSVVHASPSSRHRQANIPTRASALPGGSDLGTDCPHQDDCFVPLSLSSTQSHDDCLSRSTPINGDCPPKKAVMFGEVYETMLQSALEDQAQHFEGEISRLRAELTAERVVREHITKEEKAEIETLQASISDLRKEADHLAKQHLEAQAQEAGHRATSQRLLREQANAKELVDKLRAEASRERTEGEMQVEELEQQVGDLTAYLKIQHQISQNHELKNSQIYAPAKSQKRGGKKSRKFRK